MSVYADISVRKTLLKNLHDYVNNISYLTVRFNEIVRKIEKLETGRRAVAENTDNML